MKLAVLDLDKKEVRIQKSDTEYADMQFYNNQIYCRKSIYYFFENYDEGYHYTVSEELYSIDMNFDNETLILDNAYFYIIYKERILFQKSTSLDFTFRKIPGFYVCDLDGSNITPIGELDLSVFAFTVHNDIVYSYGDHRDDELFIKMSILDLRTGESTLHTPRVYLYDMQFDKDFIYARDWDEKKIYKISYDWENVELIGEYYCRLNLIDDYLYLTHYFYDAGSPDPDFFVVEDAIYRIRLDGSGFEKFVTINFY